jgi:hypothetical protein
VTTSLTIRDFNASLVLGSERGTNEAQGKPFIFLSIFKVGLELSTSWDHHHLCLDCKCGKEALSHTCEEHHLHAGPTGIGYRHQAKAKRSHCWNQCSLRLDLMLHVSCGVYALLCACIIYKMALLVVM